MKVKANLRGALGVLVLATTLAGCATSSQPPAEEIFELDSFRWRAEATAQDAIIATNDWGDLRVRTADRGGLVVSAMVQKIGTRRDELEIRVEETADAVVVKVVPRVARPRGRVDLTLIVPPRKRLKATTAAGLAEIKYKGDVVARTRGGAIVLETPGHASAHSESGSILAKLAGASWERPLAFASASGDITVWLREDANVVLRAETAGAIDVGFTHQAANDTGEGRRVQTTVGDGGAQLRIDSVDGDVRVAPYAASRAGSVPSPASAGG